MFNKLNHRVDFSTELETIKESSENSRTKKYKAESNLHEATFSRQGELALLSDAQKATEIVEENEEMEECEMKNHSPVL